MDYAKRGSEDDMKHAKHVSGEENMLIALLRTKFSKHAHNAAELEVVEACLA